MQMTSSIHNVRLNQLKQLIQSVPSILLTLIMISDRLGILSTDLTNPSAIRARATTRIWEERDLYPRSRRY